MREIEELQSKLSYRFSDTKVLERALTHSSKGSDNYERLEFLGDSILGFVVAEWLYHRFPSLTEGQLTRMRSTIVRRDTLVKVARALELGPIIVLGEGELKSGGAERDSILADTVEAIIGAMYIDGGMDACKALVSDKFREHLELLDPESVYKDAKSRLQEYLQQRGLHLPVYSIMSISGEPHLQVFEVECRIPDVDETFTASAKSRRRAEQSAAKKAYETLTR